MATMICHDLLGDEQASGVRRGLVRTAAAQAQVIRWMLQSAMPVRLQLNGQTMLPAYRRTKSQQQPHPA